eukprot:GHVP01011148.1.p1 GENE.GHVP01011148.1~~GHVP01011148.1.p1  ORF type:complete len:382 (-),score=52.52 GHVP01011148.1:688-1833(-)
MPRRQPCFYFQTQMGDGRPTPEEGLSEETAATCIQTQWRRTQALRNLDFKAATFSMLLLRSLAASWIQSAWKSYVVREVYQQCRDYVFLTYQGAPEITSVELRTSITENPWEVPLPLKYCTVLNGWKILLMRKEFFPKDSRFEFKFVINGKSWRYSKEYPIVADTHGNINNLIHPLSSCISDRNLESSAVEQPATSCGEQSILSKTKEINLGNLASSSDCLISKLDWKNRSPLFSKSLISGVSNSHVDRPLKAFNLLHDRIQKRFKKSRSASSKEEYRCDKISTDQIRPKKMNGAILKEDDKFKSSSQENNAELVGILQSVPVWAQEQNHDFGKGEVVERKKLRRQRSRYFDGSKEKDLNRKTIILPADKSLLTTPKVETD